MSRVYLGPFDAGTALSVSRTSRGLYSMTYELGGLACYHHTITLWVRCQKMEINCPLFYRLFNGAHTHTSNNLPQARAVISEDNRGLEELEVVLERTATMGSPLMPGEWRGES